MSTARKMRAPRTEPAIAPVGVVAVLDVVDALGELEEVADAERSTVEDGDWLFIQEESPERATVLRKLPPWRKLASTIENIIWVPL